jgi:hypothetical protein
MGEERSPRDQLNFHIRIEVSSGIRPVLRTLSLSLSRPGMGEERSPEEFESFKAVSISCGRLPGVQISPFRVSAKDLPDVAASQADTHTYAHAFTLARSLARSLALFLARARSLSLARSLARSRSLCLSLSLFLSLSLAWLTPESQ